MCEILLRVKDEPATGNLFVDCKQPKAGDVLVLVNDGFPWGVAELGGPTYDEPQLQWFARDFSVLVDQSVDLTKIDHLQQVPLDKIIGKVIGQKVAIADGQQSAFGIDTKSIDPAAQTVTGTAYTYDVTGYTTKPMSAHPRGIHDIWRVVKLPSVTIKQAGNMLTPEMDVDPNVPSPFLQSRMNFIDFAKVQAQRPVFYSFIRDDLRTSPSISLPYTAAQLAAFVSVRPAIPFTGAQSAAYVAAMKGG